VGAVLTAGLFVLAGFLTGGAISMYRQDRKPITWILGAAATMALAGGVMRL
jgi:hypothetical protein